jgi:hypothetical protein
MERRWKRIHINKTHLVTHVGLWRVERIGIVADILGTVKHTKRQAVQKIA